MSSRRATAENFLRQGLQTAQTDKALGYATLCSSVEVDPTFTEGWRRVGGANAEIGQLPAAVAAWRRAIELEPRDAKTYVDIGHRLYHMGRIDEAREASLKAIELDPILAYAYTNLSLIESIAGNLDLSLDYARQAFNMDGDPINEMSLAFALLHSGRYAEGFKHYETRFPYKLQHYFQWPYPRWAGDDLAGKTILCAAEQGLGDTLRFMRFVPELARRAGQVLLSVQSDLLSLVQTLTVESWAGNVVILAQPHPFPAADFWTTFACLPAELGLTDQQIIEAQAPEFQVPRSATSWMVRDRKLHIGIAWGGNPNNDIDKWRSANVELFLELYRVPGVQLYSLQVGPRVQELYTARAESVLKDLSPMIRDVLDSATLMQHLDLIVSVESLVPHLAGLLHKECWVIYGRHGGDWQHGRHRTKPLWYPKSTIMRQGPDAQWRPVMERVIKELKGRISGN